MTHLNIFFKFYYIWMELLLLCVVLCFLLFFWSFLSVFVCVLCMTHLNIFFKFYYIWMELLLLCVVLRFLLFFWSFLLVFHFDESWHTKIQIFFFNLCFIFLVLYLNQPFVVCRLAICWVLWANSTSSWWILFLNSW